MLTLITLFVLALVSFLALFLIDKYGDSDGFWGFFTGFISVCSILAFIGFLCAFINLDNRINAKIEQYKVITETVESYNGQDYGNMGALVESVVDMNETIATHKAQSESKWVGLWYSKEIGQLEPIRFDRKTNTDLLE